MGKLKDLVLKLCISFVGIIIVGGIPSLFTVSRGQYINFAGFVDSLKIILTSLTKLSELTYVPAPNVVKPLFPFIFNPISYSLILLFSSLVIAYIVSTSLTIGTMMLPTRFVNRTKISLSLLDSIPDLLLIYSFQLAIIFLFKKTGIIFFNFASLPGEKIYFLPIVCLSIYPAIFLFRLTVTLFEEELTKNYITLAKGKGIKTVMIMYKHILPNVFVSLFYHSKNVMWFMLTNLLILERMFNIPGITAFIYEYLSPEVFVIGVLLLFIPTFFFNIACEMVVDKYKKVM